MTHSLYSRLLLVLVCLVVTTSVFAHDKRARTAVNIPDVAGFKTLKCDFHIHTVFSDGQVWPDVRSEEAWREGLDAIAITDHIEYQPHKDDLPTNHNRSYEIAKSLGDILEMTVIRGSEITRKMPPGHINAIFLDRSDVLDVEDWRAAIKTAKEQGAFIFWNHPGWTGQQPDGVARWYQEHTELLDGGFIHGIEVVNERDYYPEAHRWCIEKKLTMLSNSDIHAPLNLEYDATAEDHRPLTLVFATENSLGAIKEALFARRTAVYSGNLLAGDEQFLRPIYDASISTKTTSLTVKGTGRAYLQIRNTSDITFQLEGNESFPEIRVPKTIVLQAGKTVLLEIAGTTKDRTGQKQFSIPYTVKNVKVGPDQGLPVKFDVSVTFVPVP